MKKRICPVLAIVFALSAQQLLADQLDARMTPVQRRILKIELAVDLDRYKLLYQQMSDARMRLELLDLDSHPTEADKNAQAEALEKRVQLLMRKLDQLRFHLAGIGERLALGKSR